VLGLPPSPPRSLTLQTQGPKCSIHHPRLSLLGILTCPRTARHPPQMTRTWFSRLDLPSTTHPGSKPYRSVPRTCSLVRKPGSLWHLALPARLTEGTPTHLTLCFLLVSQAAPSPSMELCKDSHRTQTESGWLPPPLHTSLCV